MADINVIKIIREKTGAGVMEITKALEIAKNNPVLALQELKKAGQIKAEKKQDRTIKSGLIDSYLHGHKIGVLIELGCETDFAAKSPIFQELARNLSMQIASMSPENTEALFGQEYIKDPSQNIQDLLNAAIAQIGENITIRRFIRYELGEKLND